MLEQISPLWDVYLLNKERGNPLVLATLVKTIGSSYKKAGAMMLIEQDRTTHGLISGGCLEADVAEHAMTVFESDKAQQIEYDLSDESIFGLGAGCDGTIYIVLQLLTGDYLPFSALNPLAKYTQPPELYIEYKVDSKYPIGSFYVTKNNQITEQPVGFHAATKTKPFKFIPPPHIIIFGAGTDVTPLCQLLNLLHWQVTIVDHRIARLQLIQQDERTEIVHANGDTLAETLNELKFDAAIIMTHNLARDAQYLKLSATTSCGFVGLLGPPARRDKVLKIANIKMPEIALKLRAPVGLNLGGRMPENIALSIVAQLQAYIYQT
ncbi:MAG: cytochrome oxidase I [marine bacterium B5-7]|nr:MAG: cytochrome oxidase I [marine bacterium B5-7]